MLYLGEIYATELGDWRLGSARFTRNARALLFGTCRCGARTASEDPGHDTQPPRSRRPVVGQDRGMLVKLFVDKGR